MLSKNKLIKSVNKNINILSKMNSAYINNNEIKKVHTINDFKKMPFMTRDDLDKIDYNKFNNIVRIHSTSGTTGNPIIIPYTKTDIDDWTKMMKRCYEVAGVSKDDIVQISVGYGLWTAGVGFQLGCEKLGATAVPIGCDNTEKQFTYFEKMRSTVMCATASFALYLSENVESNNIYLKKGIFGSEVWGKKTRKKISEQLNIDVYDIYGLTEVYGPGIAISCKSSKFMHYWNDYLYFEIINPETGENLPNGEYGELVITTLKKEGLPLIRYRTHDITRIVDMKCNCGINFPQIDSIIGRTDDMIKFHGVKFFPSQILEILDTIPEVSTEYFIKIENINKKDVLTVVCEIINENCNCDFLKSKIQKLIKQKIGINVEIEVVKNKQLERKNKKTKRVYDFRNK